MTVKLRLVFSITILFFSFYGFSQVKYWQRSSSSLNSLQKTKLGINIDRAKIFSLNEKMLKSELKAVTTNKSSYRIVYFPNEKGEQIAFRVFEKSVLSPELARKYPEIKSYSGYSLDKKGEKIVFSVSPSGIQSMIVHSNKEQATFMQKVAKNKGDYVVYNRADKTIKDKGFICKTKASVEKANKGLTNKLADDQLLRKYRLAVSASGEYTAFHGGTVAQALAAINATVTRINEIFETDLAVSLELVANTDLVIFDNEKTDPYNGNLNIQVQNTLTTKIGEANYDIGHLFHEAPDGGDSGFLGSTCVDGKKGSAYASSKNPEGDTYDIDLVAHEMGHQFGANHTWSYESEGTLVQVEPGSGTTIMGYAGIVPNNDVADKGDLYFHYSSISQISEYLATTNCATTATLVNTPPDIVPTGDFFIPKSTAFVLTGNATDVDPLDVLTYTWEQIDNGIVTYTNFGPTNPYGANFRSQKPSINPERYFPKLQQVIQGKLTETNPDLNSEWETVSSVEREMNFALTVRDNSLEGGQVSSDIVKVNVVGDSGPFMITSQETNEIYSAGTIKNVKWDVANTNKAPINSTTVDIFMSTDGGLTFPIVLGEDVSNDGEYKVLIPGIETISARIMVKAHNNIFYAVNAANFTIEESEVVLNFPTLEYEVCMPGDITAVFNYETYLGFNEVGTFSVLDAPAGLGVAFSSNTAQANNTPITITFSNTGAIAEGIYPVTVRATSASVTKEVVLDLSIYDTVFSNVVLQSPVDGMSGAGISENLVWKKNLLDTSYDIEVATDVAFATIVDSATVTFNSYTPKNLASETTYYWRVKPKNLCGEGIFGAPFSFTTVIINCTNKSMGNFPVEISSAGTSNITSKIHFFEDLIVADVNVNLNVSHTYLSDLIISLTSPSGTVVVLTSSSCGEFENIEATFDGEANIFVCGITKPSISGVVKPLGSLASFNGESLLGEWILTIEDTASSDGGALNDFSLDICAEGVFRPDADNDNVFDDGDDLCLGTPTGVDVDTNGCAIYRLPTNNFSTTLKSESCRESNDGSIAIIASQIIDYTIVANGEGVNSTITFTDKYNLENLKAGTYNICITGVDGAITYEELCFNVVIKEPELINVSTSLVGNKKVVVGLQGATLYTIDLNGLIVQTQESSITLNLDKGANSLKIIGDLICQGVYEEQFYVLDYPIISPNPIAEKAKIYFGKQVKNAEISVHGINGQLINTKKYNVGNTELELDFSGLAPGVYIINFEGVGIKGTCKMIKE